VIDAVLAGNTVLATGVEIPVDDGFTAKAQ